MATIQAAERELHMQIATVGPRNMTTSSAQRAAFLLADSVVRSTKLAAFVTGRAAVSIYQKILRTAADLRRVGVSEYGV